VGELTIVLPGERSPSQNEYYSSPHWSIRSKIAKRIHTTVQERLLSMGIRKGETCNKRVAIEVTNYFDKRPLDASNICLKIYEDSLKGWLIEDDSPAYVDRVTAISRLDRKNPRVEITIREVEG
jgi:Holliday junction resolvase RusA-like endonuclease